MKGKFDESSQKSKIIITETLGKYGYKLDSVKKELQLVRDSSRTKIYMGDDPVLSVTDGLEGTKKAQSNYPAW